jgi:hypothetical protein
MLSSLWIQYWCNILAVLQSRSDGSLGNTELDFCALLGLLHLTKVICMHIEVIYLASAPKLSSVHATCMMHI